MATYDNPPQEGQSKFKETMDKLGRITAQAEALGISLEGIGSGIEKPDSTTPRTPEYMIETTERMIAEIQSRIDAAESK